MDALHEISSCGSKSRFPARKTVSFQGGKNERIFVRIAGYGHNDIVTTMFALVAHHAGDPPRRGMIEEKAFYQPLHRIEQIVMTSDMSQFMHQNGFDLFDRQTREQAIGNQDDRPEMAQGERDIDQAGLKAPAPAE